MTVNLCTGLSRLTRGRLPKGTMGAAEAGESRRVPVEIEAGGVMYFVGPQLAGDA